MNTTELKEYQLNKNNLYREEMFTDLSIGGIIRYTPVTPDGSIDKTRKPVFYGKVSIITQMGPIPIQTVIQAKDLQQAIKLFPETMKAAIEKFMEEVRKIEQQKQSRIIVP
ncbi:MAG: phasin family protein [Desulfobacterales bacterium]|nr:phasin family protein [Desulfobacterales bacterium]